MALNSRILAATSQVFGVMGISNADKEFVVKVRSTCSHLPLVFLGLSIYGPVMFIGLYSMELVPKHVAGAASGLTGTFSYIFGSIFATLGMGVIVDNFGWGATFILLIISAILAIITTVLSRDKRLEF